MSTYRAVSVSVLLNQYSAILKLGKGSLRALTLSNKVISIPHLTKKVKKFFLALEVALGLLFELECLVCFLQLKICNGCILPLLFHRNMFSIRHMMCIWSYNDVLKSCLIGFLCDSIAGSLAYFDYLSLYQLAAFTLMHCIVLYWAESNFFAVTCIMLTF